MRGRPPERAQATRPPRRSPCRCVRCSGEWKSAAFKEYNFAALGQDATLGSLHPLMKVRAEFRKILLEMG